eukprot:1393971-Amorphochlora_amoeboformis.AAC.1
MNRDVVILQALPSFSNQSPHPPMGSVACGQGQNDIVFCRESSGSISHLGTTCAISQIPARKDEDRYSVGIWSKKEKIVKPLVKDCGQSDEDILCVGIYDGHGGKDVANLLQSSLLDEIFTKVSQHEEDSKKKATAGVPDDCIIEAYRAMDAIAQKSIRLKAGSVCVGRRLEGSVLPRKPTKRARGFK